MAAKPAQTVIRIEETADGYRATQHDVDIEGTGPSAARAVEEYARRIAEEVHEQ